MRNEEKKIIAKPNSPMDGKARKSPAETIPPKIM
jgi:hypothetical protein